MSLTCFFVSQPKMDDNDNNFDTEWNMYIALLGSYLFQTHISSFSETESWLGLACNYWTVKPSCMKEMRDAIIK